jgi:hypothetical protein
MSLHAYSVAGPIKKKRLKVQAARIKKYKAALLNIKL